MALPERVTPEQAAAVFRRAAELEAAGVSGETGGVLDDRALVDIGREVGLAPASVEAALAELRGGALSPGAESTWGTVTSSRSVPGTPTEVVAAIDDEARRSMLGVVQSVDGATVWTRSAGASAALARSLRGRRQYPLLALTGLRATATEVPSRPGITRVRLEGSLLFPTRLLSARNQVLSVVGIGGGALLALAAPGGDPGIADWVTDTGGAIAIALGAGTGLRAYRRAVAAAETALDRLLDQLGHAPVPPWPTNEPLLAPGASPR